MLRIAQMISPEEIPKSFRPRSNPFSTAETICWWVNPLLGMKDGSKASLKIDNSLPTQVFGLFVGHALQRLLGLHHRDGVREPLQIFRQTALIGAAKKPLGKFLGIVGWKIRVFCVSRQFNHSLRPQHAIQMLVQEDFGKAPVILYQVSYPPTLRRYPRATPRDWREYNRRADPRIRRS